MKKGLKQCFGSGSVCFWPPGSVSHRYGSDSAESFDHQAKMVRKTFIFTVLRLLCDFLSLKNDVNVPSKSYKQKNLKKILFAGALKVTEEKRSGFGSVRQRYGIRICGSGSGKKITDSEHTGLKGQFLPRSTPSNELSSRDGIPSEGKTCFNYFYVFPAEYM